MIRFASEANSNVPKILDLGVWYGRCKTAIGRACLILGCVWFASCEARGELVTLYDGSGLPSIQPWLIFGNDFLGSASQTSVAGGVQLITDNTARAGYSNYIPLPIPSLKNAGFPTLNRALGFELGFRVQVNSESHVSNSRAGYSVLLLGSDAKGIEIGFWTDKVWAQNVGFTQGESVALNTTVARDYRLQIVDDNYQLFDGNQSILSGSVRAYGTPSVPYELPNYVFLGDNTTSARADVVQGAITLQSNLSSVPEPTSLLLLGATGIGLIVGRGWRNRVLG
ncbi:MAG: PEP-CTERM sorting domain-containing protein [Pirellula sp.]